MVKINLKIDKKLSYVIVALLAIVVIGQITIAYNSIPPNPASMGHSLNEVEMPGCSTGEILVKGASDWECQVVTNTRETVPQLVDFATIQTYHPGITDPCGDTPDDYYSYYAIGCDRYCSMALGFSSGFPSEIECGAHRMVCSCVL